MGGYEFGEEAVFQVNDGDRVRGEKDDGVNKVGERLRDDQKMISKKKMLHSRESTDFIVWATPKTLYI